MEVTVLQIAVILVSGLAAGFINTLAGGGSFISLAALQLVGLDLSMANGTNRVSVEVGAIMSSLGFRSKGISDPRMALHFVIPAAIGAIIGARLIINVPEQVLERVVATAIILMLATLLFDSKRWVRKQQVELTPKRRFWIYVVFLAIGVYGGAIQAGVGFLLTTAIVMLAGQDLVRAAYFKAAIVAVYTLFAVAIFAWNGQVNWVLWLVVSAGSGLGSWLASHLAVRKGEKFVRGVLITALVVLSVRYLGIIPGF